MELIARNRQQEDVARALLGWPNPPEMLAQTGFDFRAIVAPQPIIPPNGRIGNFEGREHQADAIEAGLSAPALRPKAYTDERASALRMVVRHRVRLRDSG